MSIVWDSIILLALMFSFSQYQSGKIKIFPKFIEIGFLFANIAVTIFYFVDDPNQPFFLVDTIDPTSPAAIIAKVMSNAIVAILMWLRYKLLSIIF